MNQHGNYTAKIGDSGLVIAKPRPIVVRMSDIEPCEIVWLWPGRIPSSRISLLAGMPGLGKSILTCDLAARVTTGRKFPDGSQSTQGSVLLISCEDDPADTIRPRLDAAGADPSRVHLLSAIEHDDVDGKKTETLFTLRHVEMLREAVAEISDCRLVIIDPVGSYLGEGTNANSDNEVRSILTPVANIAKESGAAFLIVVHTRKAEAKFADDAIMGSRGFTGLARIVWHLMPDPDNESKLLFLQGKCNIDAKSNGMSFEIQGKPAFLNWSDDPEERTANDVMATLYEKRKDKRSPALDDAVDWLAEYLVDGSKLKDDVLNAAGNAGFNERTILTASRELNIQKAPTGFGLPWSWSLDSLNSMDQCSVDTDDTDDTVKTREETTGLSDGLDSLTSVNSVGHCGEDKDDTDDTGEIVTMEF